MIKQECKSKDGKLKKFNITPTGGNDDKYLKEVEDILSSGKSYLLAQDREGNYWSNESGEFKIIHKADE